jgi:hypothetical protein
MSTDPFEVAERLAPQPDNRFAAEREWYRYFAARGLAAHAAFRAALSAGSAGADLGYLAEIGMLATSAALLLDVPEGEHRSALLWDFTPEAGALNGEYVDHLASNLDDVGINPAEIYPWFEAADFATPLSAPAVSE